MVRSIAFSALASLALVPFASAQSSSSSSGSNSYAITLNSSSVGTLSDLSISGNLYTYNLIVPFNPADGADNSAYFAPYTSLTGNGSVLADVNPLTGYDSSLMSGFAGVDSGATANPSSSNATASVGTELDLDITNNGVDDVILNTSILAFVSGDASITGTHGTGVNYATVDTYAGFVTYNFANVGNTFQNPFLRFTGDDLGTTTSVNGSWKSLGNGFYSLDYTLTIRPGETHRMGFYSSSQNIAAVPEPASLAALGLGAATVLRRRRENK